MIRYSSAAFGILITLALASRIAHAAFVGDLVPRLSGSQIITDGISDEDGSFASNVRVFQYTLGDITPGFTEDPGFQPQTNSGLPGSSFIGFNILSSLRYWDGTGTPTFTPAPATTSFELYFGTQRTFITPASAAQDGFVIQQLTSQGAGHRHLNAQLLGTSDAAGTYLDSLGNGHDAPPDGIYTFAIQVTDNTSQTTDPATYVSAPTWLVYNQGLSDAQLTTGADAINATLAAPEPATLSLLTLSTAGAFVRRRRSTAAWRA